ncbi:uncharacterized protein LOC144640042 [Oculina patagonica]
MKPAVVFSLLMMFAVLTMVTKTVGKPANEEEHAAEAKSITFYQKNVQSDSQMDEARCYTTTFCGVELRCCEGRTEDENVSGAKKKYLYDNKQARCTSLLFCGVTFYCNC